MAHEIEPYEEVEPYENVVAYSRTCRSCTERGERAMACQASPDKTSLEKLNDDSITAAVEGKLAADN